MWHSLALIVLTWAGFACPQPVAAKDSLVIGVSQFPSSLNPDIDPEVIKVYVLGFAQRPVTAFDKDWKNSCLLCTELPTLENGLARFEDLPDGRKGMAVTLELKPDLKWGDGMPVTARDIAFTWRVAKDPNAGFSNTHAWTRVTQVDVVDDHKAVLHLDRRTLSYNEWDQLLPEHIEGPIFDKAAGSGGYINTTAYNRAPTTPGLYDGPYLVTGYESGARIVLDPNPYWPGAAPAIKHIVIRVIDNTAALEANLLSGDVDMVAGEGIGLTIDQVLALRRQHPDQFTYLFKPSLAYEHIDLQLGNPILADVRIRQALLYALDRKTLVDKLFEGLQPVAATFVNPLDPNHSDDVATYPYDPARARALLAAAGWTPGSDGICRNAKGDRLTLDFGTTAGNRLRELQQAVLQSQWKAACIATTVRNEPARTLFGDTLKRRLFTGLALYGWFTSVGESPRETLDSHHIPDAANNYGGANYVAFSDPKMDADIAAAETEFDPVRDKAIWADMQKIYAEALPALPLFFRSEAHVIPNWLKGYAPTGHADMAVLWAETWHSE